MSNIGIQEIHEVVASIWTSLLRMQIEPSPSANVGECPHLTGSVQIHGGWNGTVVVRCTRALSIRIAAAMFEIDRAVVSADDIRDAIGEITNITAGNLKALMPEPCTLGLPVVTPEVSSSKEPADDVALHARFESADEPFIVTLITQR